jgi:hypothetical protein
MDEKIKSGLEGVLKSHFDELFRGDLYFPRFRVLGYERVDEKTYKAKLELLYLDCHNESGPYLLRNVESISNPVLPIELIHLITTEVITWQTKEDADTLSLDPYLIDIENEVEERYGWDDLIISDLEVEYALSAAGLDKYDVSQDDYLNKVVMTFLNSDDKELESIKKRLKPFLINPI